MKFIHQIGAIPLFRGLAEAQFQELATIVVDREFRRGQTIFMEGEEGNGFYVVNIGKVKIFKLFPDGRNRSFIYSDRGSPLPRCRCLPGSSSYPAPRPRRTAAYFFPWPGFLDLIRRHPSLSLNILAMLSKRLQH